MLARVVAVRPQETAALLFGFAYFFCLLFGYYLLRPLRDAMGLVGGAGQLQWLFTATFVSMLALVPVFGAVATRWPPRRFVPLVYRFFALNILVFGALFAAGVQQVAVSRVFFVWISVFNLFVISIFWSVMADHFSSEQGKRLFGFIAAGGTAGALFGPALAAALVVKFGVVTLTVIAACLLELAVQCFHALVRTAGSLSSGDAGPSRLARQYEAGVGGGVFSGLTLLFSDRYLFGIVLFLLLHTFASTFLYFEQGRIVAESFSDTAARTRFFALVDLAVSALTLVLQVFVTGRLIQRFGIATALVLLPLAGLLAFSAIAAWPTIAVLGAAQALRRALDYAIVRPARETLFTVVSRAAKYKAKNVIETVVYRGGDAVSGWMFAGLAAVGLGFAGITAVFAPLTGLWVWLSVWLARNQEKRAAQVQARTSRLDHQEAGGTNDTRIA